MNQHTKDVNELLTKLEKGQLRAASKNAQGEWVVHTEVKQGILEAFKQGTLQNMGSRYVDKHTLPPRDFQVADGIRIVPEGSAIRRGAYLARGVIVMPPSYVNVGAYVDEGTMVDSHVLVGSCAQIGKNVHLSAGVQIGGVLEPIGMSPVIIEDHAFIGAGSIVVEGIRVGEKAVLAPGVTLSRAVPIYDLVHERQLAPGEGIPARAVVVSGTRPSKRAWADKEGLQIACALIIKYRDEKSETSLVLEECLRGE